MTNNEDTSRAYYNNLWQTDLPKKIKITNWRIYNNYIPTFGILCFRRVSNSALCPRRREGTEALEHVIRDYLE